MTATSEQLRTAADVYHRWNTGSVVTDEIYPTSADVADALEVLRQAALDLALRQEIEDRLPKGTEAVITAAEGQELLDLVRAGVGLLSDDYQRLTRLAERVAHDARVQELSRHLGELCAQIPEDGGEAPELFKQIRDVADRLSALS